MKRKRSAKANIIAMVILTAAICLLCHAGHINKAQAALTDIYVNATWVGTTPGADPDDAGPATSFGTDSFATIQDAINAAD